MPTIDDLYKSYDAKNLSWSVEINLVALTAVEEISWDFRIGVVPTASIKVSGRAPAVAKYLAPVHINAGFNGTTERQFTGIVLDVDRNDQGDTIRCVGGSWPLDVNYHEVVYTFDNVTSNDALEDLFEDAGLVGYIVDVPAWTICAVSPVTHEWETYGEAVTSVGEVDGCRWLEFPSGTVRIKSADPIPALTSWRTYFTGHLLPGYAMTWPTGTSLLADGYPRIRYVSAQERVRDCKNRARVKGQVIDTAGGHGTTDPVDITATAYAASPWVLNPDGSQAYNDILFSSDLIDTDVKAGEVATRLVVANNRLLQNVDVEIDGDPQIRLARTVQIIDPDYSGINSRWYVDGYSSRITADDFATVLYLIGGAEAGSEVMIDPFALFTYVVEREVIGDREYALVTFDSTPSYDPDGTIVSRAWADSLGLVAGSATIVNVRVDPAAAGTWTVTLTVTDDDGLTSTLTLPIDVGPATNPNVFIPALFLAFGSYASASPDGGTTWNDQALAGCISAGAKAADGVHYGIGLFGTSGGKIYRTTDYCASALTLVVDAGVTGGQPINHIWWDLNHPTAVWAITQNGGVFLSWNDGLTWAYYEDLAARFGLTNIRLQRIGTPLGLGGVWIFGGTGTGWPGIWWDAALDHNWVGATLGGDLAADLADLAHPELYVAEAAARQYPELAIILESASHTPAVYYAPNVFDGSTWRRATGATGTSHGRWIGIDQEVGKFGVLFDTRDTYVGDVSAGVLTVSAAAAKFDVGDAANHALWLGWMVNGKAGTYLVAAEATGTTAGTIYKTWDRFGNIGKVRPAMGFTAPPAGAKAKMIAIGAPQTSAVMEARVLLAAKTTAPKSFAAWRTGPGNWIKNTFTTELGSSGLILPRPLTADVWFIMSCDDWMGMSDAGSQVVRTLNKGVNWASYAQPKSGGEYWQDFTLDAAGNLWGLTCDRSAYPDTTAKVYKSTDYGDNWTLMYTRTNIYGGYLEFWLHLVCHPTNQNIIAIVGKRIALGSRIKAIYTVDGGVNWTSNFLNYGWYNLGHAYDFIMLANSRIVGTALDSSPTEFAIGWADISDGYGVWHHSYHTAESISHGARLIGVVGNQMGTKLFALELMTMAYPAEFARVIMSTDGGGLTWAPLDNDVPYPGSTKPDGGLAYDEVNDALYVFGGTNKTTNVRLVMKMQPVTQDGVWIDVSDTLVPIGAETHYHTSGGYGGLQIAAIPR